MANIYLRREISHFIDMQNSPSNILWYERHYTGVFSSNAMLQYRSLGPPKLKEGMGIQRQTPNCRCSCHTFFQLTNISGVKGLKEKGTHLRAALTQIRSLTQFKCMKHNFEMQHDFNTQALDLWWCESFSFSKNQTTVCFVRISVPHTVFNSFTALHKFLVWCNNVSEFFLWFYLFISWTEFYCGKLHFGVVACRGKQFIPRGNWKLKTTSVWIDPHYLPAREVTETIYMC